jgi:SAM-dependent methyltransferase
MYLSPRPTENESEEYYPREYAPHGVSSNRLVGGVKAMLERIRIARYHRFAPPGATVLEVGCGTGGSLAALRDIGGYEVRGVEPCRRAAEHARRALGLAVETSTLEQAGYPARSFDLVVMKHVLEHVPSPRTTLAEVARVLKPGGTVVLLVPNVASLERYVFGSCWYGYDIFWYLYHFTPATLSRYLDGAGFGAVVCRQSIVPSSWIWSLRYVVGEKMSVSARAFTPDSPLLQAAFLPLGVVGALTGHSGRMTITARKGAAARGGHRHNG